MNSATGTHSPVAVIGATGTVGGLVLDALVARGATVRVLVRRPRPAGYFGPGVEQVFADLRDESALRTALTGVAAALYVSPHEEGEEELARNFVRAAEATGTRIVFAGVHVPARTLQGRLRLAITGRLLPHYRPKLRIGQLIATSRTNPVIFIPTNFFQNDELVEDDIRGGRFPMPMKRLNRVDVRDLAELCARALSDPAYPAGEHMVAGPESLSGLDCARIWSDALGRPVRYVGDDDRAWRAILRHRLQGKKLEDFEATAEFLGRRSVVVPKAVTATTRLLGRAPRSYRDYVAQRAALTRTAARRSSWPTFQPSACWI